MKDLESIDVNQLLSITLVSPRAGMWDGKKVGLATPPIKTNAGWLVFYHGVSHDNVYRIGAVLLNLKTPEKLLVEHFTHSWNQ